jgi:putative oxidoreductase
MEILLLIGRLIFGGYFLWNGINHFKQREMLTTYAISKDVPAPAMAVMGSGLLILLGGASIILGIGPQLGTWLIIIFLLGVSPQVHNFWAISDPDQKMTEMINFTKNMALVGAALMFMGIPEPWPLSLGALGE